MFVINKYTGILENKELKKISLNKIVNPIRVDLEVDHHSNYGNIFGKYQGLTGGN